MEKQRDIFLLAGILSTLVAPSLAIAIDQCEHTLDLGSYTACYWYPARTAKWQDAEKECGAAGGHVIAVTSPEVHDVAMAIMRNHSIRDMWLGIREESFAWRWINTFSESYEQGCHKDDASSPDFVYSSPIVNITYESCVQLCATKRYIYAGLQEGTCWCGNQFGRFEQTDQCNILCEGDPEQVCGGSLANHVLAVSGVYSHWELGQPNNHQSYQTCALLDREYDFAWNDVVCREWQGLVCQVAKASQYCAENATNTVVVGNSCYIIDPQKRTWFQSRDHCVTNLGGELATISNEAEQLALQQYLLTHTVNVAGFWIGLIKARWQWSTGDDLVFTSWDNGRPNGQVKYQSCAKMGNNGLWDDTDCDGLWSFICQTDNAVRATQPVRTIPPQLVETETVPPEIPTTTAQPLLMEEGEPLFSKGEIAAIGASAGFVVIILIMIACKCWIHQGREAREKRFDYFFGVDLPVSSTNDVRKPHLDKKQSSKKEMNGSLKKQEAELMRSFESTTVEITPDVTHVNNYNGDVIHRNSDVMTEIDDVTTGNDDVITGESDGKSVAMHTDTNDTNDNETDAGNGDSAYEESVETLDLIADLDDTAPSGADNKAMMF